MVNVQKIQNRAKNSAADLVIIFIKLRNTINPVQVAESFYSVLMLKNIIVSLNLTAFVVN